MTRTKMALIGANGSLGTELCLLMADDPKIELIPVIRNQLGAAFLNHRGYHCKIADICQPDDAREVLRGIDIVVISSYTHTPGQIGYNTNLAMIENCIRYSDPGCKVVYFSTIRAFAGKVDLGTPRIGIPLTYDRNKRRLEKALFKLCDLSGKPGYAFRLGHVFGEHQSRTQVLRQRLQESASLTIPVAPDKPSNLVHTVTIENCIQLCAASRVQPGLYSLVNVPQWSWQDVFTYYNQSNTELKFRIRPDQTVSWRLRATKSLKSYIGSKRESLRELRQFLPAALDQRLQGRLYSVQNVRSEILPAIQAQSPQLTMREFAYKPIPEPFVPGLDETRSLLEQKVEKKQGTNRRGS